MARVATGSELLERSVQSVQLDDAYTAAARCRGRMVFLGAEAGGGKTALLSRFCDRHAAQLALTHQRTGPKTGGKDTVLASRRLLPQTGGDKQGHRP